MRDKDTETLSGLAPMPERPTTAAPPAVRAAIKDRVLAQSLGRTTEAPTLDGRYRLLREIGRGGAGTVWEAEQVPLGRRVAVKLLRGHSDQQADAAPRLLREALTASRIGNDHIVRVDDVGTDEHGSPYIAMELLLGQSLAQLVVARGHLSWAEVKTIARQVCDALGAAHSVGVVHRDVKPANIIATRRDDGRWHCKLLDFGLCKTAAPTVSQLTAAGAFLGTPGYVAPEQIRGEFVDGRADIYGLACVMVEMLTGRPAFWGAGRQDVIASQMRGWDPKGADLPAEVEALLRRALALNPQERHCDAAALGHAIAAVRVQDPTKAPVRPRSGIGRGYLLGVGTTVLCAGALATIGRSHMQRPVAPAAVIASEPARPPPSPAPPANKPAPEPTPARQLAVAPAVEGPDPEPRRRPKRPRKPKLVEASSPPQAPERAAFAEGIRDPFARL